MNVRTSGVIAALLLAVLAASAFSPPGGQAQQPAEPRPKAPTWEAIKQAQEELRQLDRQREVLAREIELAQEWIKREAVKEVLERKAKEDLKKQATPASVEQKLDLILDKLQRLERRLDAQERRAGGKAEAIRVPRDEFNLTFGTRDADVVSRDQLDEKRQWVFDRVAKRLGVADGKLTRDQFERFLKLEAEREQSSKDPKK